MEELNMEVLSSHYCCVCLMESDPSDKICEQCQWLVHENCAIVGSQYLCFTCSENQCNDPLHTEEIDNGTHVSQSSTVAQHLRMKYSLRDKEEIAKVAIKFRGEYNDEMERLKRQGNVYSYG